MEERRIEVFGTRSCRFTEELLDDLDWQGREYRVHLVDEDAAALRRLAQLVESPVMVPVLVEDGEVKEIGYQGRGCYVQTTPAKADSAHQDRVQD